MLYRPSGPVHRRLDRANQCTVVRWLSSHAIADSVSWLNAHARRLNTMNELFPAAQVAVGPFDIRSLQPETAELGVDKSVRLCVVSPGTRQNFASLKLRTYRSPKLRLVSIHFVPAGSHKTYRTLRNTAPLMYAIRNNIHKVYKGAAEAVLPARSKSRFTEEGVCGVNRIEMLNYVSF